MSICSEVRSILDIEGLSQVGQVKDVRVERCGKSRGRIVVKLVNEKTLCSPCLDEDVVNVSVRVIEHYRRKLRLVREGG